MKFTQILQNGPSEKKKMLIFSEVIIILACEKMREQEL